MVFWFTFAFIGSELIGSDAYFPFLFILIVVMIINIMLAMPVYDFGGRLISLIITIIVISLIYAYDFMLYSSPKQKEVFYIPMIIELAVLGGAYLLYYFQIPESWCRKVRFFQLYMTGFHFFTLMLINFYYEASIILYETMKLNSNNYDYDIDNWFYLPNIFKKG